MEFALHNSKNNLHIWNKFKKSKGGRGLDYSLCVQFEEPAKVTRVWAVCLGVRTALTF
jgi:hypothetical protein